MKRIRITGLAILAALAFGVVGVGSASAHEFVASKAGTVKGLQVNNHKFRTNAGTVECTLETSEGTAVAGSQKTNKEKVKYSGCTAFGFEANISEAEFEFSAEEWVSVLKKITIELPIPECKVTIEATKNKERKKVTYKNSAPVKTVEAKALVKGITYTSSGGACGTSGENGEYSGNSKLELVGGTIEWK
jgi:hypothetical protein